MESTMYEPVSMGRMPSLEIETALAEGNSKKMWQLAQSGLQPEAFYDTVRTHVFNLSTQSKKGNAVVADQNSSMFMWPIVFKDQEQVAQYQSVANDHKEGFTDTVMSLSRWMSNKVDLAMLSNPLDYQFLACQDPVEIRKFLTSLVWRQAIDAIGTGTVGTQLPADAPRLVYFVGSMTRRNAWPCLPPPESNSSIELTKRLHSTLCFATHDGQDSSTNGIIVGAPAPADSAMASGLKLWLNALHERYEFGQWDAVPVGGDQVDLHIELKNCERSDACIPLRTYQLGMDGIEKIMVDVAFLCDDGFARWQH